MALPTLDQEPQALSEGNGLLARLARRKFWFAAGFVLVAAIVGGAFTAMPESFRASAALMVASNEAVLRSGSSSAEAQRLGDPADIESQMLMLRSPRLARVILEDPKVIGALLADCEATRRGTWFNKLLQDVVPPPSCTGEAAGGRALMRRLDAGFSIGPTGRSRVIEVSFVSPVPETAVVVANALVAAYLNDDKERKVDTHDNAIRWLTAEVARSGEELRNAEQRVESYRGEHGIIRGQQAAISSERLSALGQQLALAQATYAQAMSRARPGTDADTPEVLASRSVSDIKLQATELAARAAELRQRLGDNHPAARAAAEQRGEVDRRLGQETRRVRDGLQRDVQAAAARVDELRSQYEKLVRDVGLAGGAEAGIAILVRDVEARREIYVEQLKKVNVLQTERRLLTGDARLVHLAELPDRPWFPKKLPFIGVGAVLAGAIGTGLALLRDGADHTFRSTSNAVAQAGVPIMGYVPWVRQRRGGWQPRMSPSSASPLQEAIRALFGRIVLVPGIPPRTLMISSADVGEGKTFLALSMALFAASTGRRVLVIEADLRRPTFRTALRLPEGSGLSEYLRDEVSASDIIDDYGGLHIITAGKPAVDSTELLSKERLDVLLREAELVYDLVVIDSPPAMLLMDAHVMARRVDGIVFCASLGRSRLQRCKQAIRDLEAARGNVLGMVVGVGRGGERPDYDVPGLRSSYLALQG